MSSKNIVLGKKSPIFLERRNPQRQPRQTLPKGVQTHAGTHRQVHTPESATPLWALNFCFVFRFVRFFEPRLRNNAYLCTLKKTYGLFIDKGCNKPLIWFPKTSPHGRPSSTSRGIRPGVRNRQTPVTTANPAPRQNAQHTFIHPAMLSPRGHNRHYKKVHTFHPAGTSGDGRRH